MASPVLYIVPHLGKLQHSCVFSYNAKCFWELSWTEYLSKSSGMWTDLFS